MKRYKLALTGAVIGLSALVLAAVPGVTSAWSDNLRVSNDGDVAIASGDTHQGALYATGERVEIAGTVEGDLYCAAGEVVITGTVRGDVLCAAQTITIDGEVGNSARLAAQAVTIKSDIGRTATVFAQNLTVEGTSVVSGDLNGAVMSLDMRGIIEGDVAMGAQLMTFAGAVRGNTDVTTERLTVSDDARFGGNLNYTATREQTVPDVVAGDVTYHKPESQTSGTGVGLAGVLMLLLPMLLTALLLVLAAPRFIDRAYRLMGERPLDTVLMGFAVVFATPIVAMLMLLTVLLAPLAIMLLLAWMLVIMLAGTFFAYWIGASLLRSQTNVVLRMAGGLLVLIVLLLIPLVNVLTILALLVVGSGMVVRTVFNNYQRPRYQIADDEPVQTERPAATKKPARKPTSRTPKK